MTKQYSKRLVSDKAYSQRQSKARSDGIFLSKKVYFKGDDRRKALRWAYQGITVIIKHLLKDDLKAPGTYTKIVAKSALLTQASTNIYMGVNLKKNEHPDGDTFIRTAYATGTGASSIGLNPETLQLPVLPPPLVKLQGLVTQVVSSQSRRWKKILERYPLNHCAGKGYYGYMDEKNEWQVKSTGWHNDVIRDKRTNAPAKNNSQDPNSLVVMMMFGDTKDLWFRRQYNAEETVLNSEFPIRQTHGTLVVIDPDDEKWMYDGTNWRHCSKMYDLLDMSWVLVFRCVKANVLVERTGTIVNPETPAYRLRRFQKAKNLMESEWYQEEIASLYARWDKWLKKYNPK